MPSVDTLGNHFNRKLLEVYIKNDSQKLFYFSVLVISQNNIYFSLKQKLEIINKADQDVKKMFSVFQLDI